MKNGHSFELMSGERRGYTTAPNRSTAIRTTLSSDTDGDILEEKQKLTQGLAKRTS